MSRPWTDWGGDGIKTPRIGGRLMRPLPYNPTAPPSPFLLHTPVTMCNKIQTSEYFLIQIFTQAAYFYIFCLMQIFCLVFCLVFCSEVGKPFSEEACECTL